ncbi:MAG: trimethylamine methyltransferase family protein [Spirochaetes bacterium]|nr:trimethylamine methyltransferase family protein [Spirochaetota bacterium]
MSTIDVARSEWEAASGRGRTEEQGGRSCAWSDTCLRRIRRAAGQNHTTRGIYMGFEYRIPRYEMLPEDALGRIHEKSLAILETIGVRVPHEGLLRFLSDYGARVDQKTSTVTFPEETVMRAIETAGKRHILYGRDRSNTAEFGYGKYNFNGTSGQYQIVDDKIRARRRPTLADLREAIAVGNGLDSINIVGAIVVPQDIPSDGSDLVVLYELLLSTAKPFCFWVFDGSAARAAIEMMSAAAGGAAELSSHPFYEILVEPVSPLSYRKEGLDILLEFAKAGLPVNVCPMVQVGASGPCSLSGTIAQENAEILSGVVLTQAVRPGLPVTYGCIPHVFDMKAAMISFGSPEQALLAAAMTQLGKSYVFPVYSNTGLSDSKVIDAQFGIESAATLVFGAAAGADIFGHLGITGADNAASFLQLIIDDELASYCRRLFSGFGLDDLDETLEEIGKVGIGGNFFGTDMTVRNFKREIWYPELFDRRAWDSWESDGGRDTLDAAIEKKGRLLKEAKENPVSPDEKLALELGRILRANGVEPPSRR